MTIMEVQRIGMPHTTQRRPGRLLFLPWKKQSSLRTKRCDDIKNVLLSHLTPTQTDSSNPPVHSFIGQARRVLGLFLLATSRAVRRFGRIDSTYRQGCFFVTKERETVRPQKSRKMNYEYDMPDAASSVHPRVGADDPNADSLWWDRAAEPGAYQIRGPGYLENKIKIPSRVSAMECIGTQYIFSRDPIRNVTAAPGQVVQEQHVGRADRPFLLVTNFVIPQIGNWVCYFARRRTEKEDPVFEKMFKEFLEGTDAHRNARFKIIPGIPEGNFIVRSTVGNKPALLGNKLDTKYYKGDNFFEIEVDVGSSMMALGM
jgi:hypothetical protein